MPRNKSEKFPSVPDPRVIVHPNMGEHRLRVDERRRPWGEVYWRVSVTMLHSHGPIATCDASTLESAIKIYTAVPNRFWFETEKDWVGPVPPQYDPDINPHAAVWTAPAT